MRPTTRAGSSCAAGRRVGRPARPFYFCDEVWTGVEYQVAAHLIYEGLVDEGLEIVRAVRARYDGYRRSPWNEAECGNHYARSLASWALLLACSGFRYDARRQAIGFAPRSTADPFRCFFSTGTGWGDFSLEERGAELAVRHGSIRLSQISVPSRAGAPIRTVTKNGDRVAARIEAGDEAETLTFDAALLTRGDVLRLDRTATSETGRTTNGS